MNMSTASRYPHYYLADVPHDLRRRVLDLCIHRQWQDAQDLLCAHSFRQYTLADLQSFYDWAPTILEQAYRSADSLSACPPSTDAASNDIQVARGARVAVASERRQLPTAPPSEPSHAASPEVSPPPPPENSNSYPEPARSQTSASAQPGASAAQSNTPRKGRSKISQLPPAILEELNTRIQNEETLQSIADWLAQIGHSNISMQNVSHWKHHGFQDWLEEQDRIEQTAALRQWAIEAARDGVADVPTAVSAFVTARLYALLRAVDTPSLRQLLREDPKQFIHYVDRLLRASRLSLHAEKLRHLLGASNVREDGIITPEKLAEIEEALRLI